tara:strand:+ start:4156 stop:9075 length:4920 start_codon:yes stop_codon:yes gene_type:complete
MALGDKKKKRKEQIGSLGLGEHTEQYVQRAYDQYSKPYTQEFEKLGAATKKEALAKGLYLSGDYGKALGNNLEDYSRKVAENVVMPMAREGMQMGLQAEQLNQQDRSQTEQERAARVGERFQASQITGVYGSGAADMRSLGLNPNDVNNFIVRDQMGRASAAEKETWQRRVNDAFIAQTGRALGEGEFNSIMGGGTVNTAGTQTLGARAQAEQERAAKAGETIATDAQAEQERANLIREGQTDKTLEEQNRAAVAQEVESGAERAERGRQFDNAQRQSQQQFMTEMTGRVNGPMVAQNFGVDDETLSGIYDQNGNVANMDAWFLASEMISSNAESQGVYLTNNMMQRMLKGEEVDVTGAPTLDTQRLTDQREQFDANLAQNLELSDADRLEQSRQFNVETMRRQIEYTTDVTGKYGAGSISADLLGIDTDSFVRRDEDGEIILDSQGQPAIDYEARGIAEEDLMEVATAAGIDLTSGEMAKILRGEAVTISGMPTLEGRKMAQNEAQALHSRRMDRAAMGLEEDQQELNEAITRAEQSGTYVDPVTGESLETLQSERLILDRQAKMFELTGKATGKDAQGNFISSLAYTAQKKQLVWEDERNELEGAIARAEQSGSFTDPVTKKTTQTLKKQLQDANIRIQDANLDFAREAEYAKQRDRFAELTGTYKPGEVSLDMLGVSDGIYDEDGSLDFAQRDENGNVILNSQGQPAIDYKKRSDTMATIATNAKRMLGRDATPTEVNALLRGDSLSLGDPIDTLAKLAQAAGFTGKYGEDETRTLEREKQEADIAATMAQLTGKYGKDLEPTLAARQQELNEAITRAEQSGTYIDPVTNHPMATLEKQRTELEADRVEYEGTRVALAEAQVMGVGADDKKTLEAMIQQAQLTGFFGEGDDAKATLAGNRAALDEEISKRVQALNEQNATFTQNMEMVREKGYWEIGESGSFTASDLGIDTTYTEQLNDMGDLLGSYEASRLKSVYRELSGEEMSDMDVITLLGGGGKNISSPMRIQTLAARSESNREEMERGQLFGELGGMKTEAARQFDENLADRKNLTTADVARINADVSRADKELEAQITQWVSQTNLDIASITGQFGVSNQMTAEDLGITIDNDGTYQGISDQVERDSPALTQSFKSIYGRDPSTNEIQRLFMGSAVHIEATPTLQARQLSQLISSQSMERANDMAKFADQNGLARDEFNQMSTQYDKEHSRLLDQMADQFTLDRMEFSLARQDLEASHTGKWGYSGKVTAQDIGFSTEVYSNLPNNIAELDKDGNPVMFRGQPKVVPNPKKKEYAQSLMDTYKTTQGEDLPGGLSRAYQLLAGYNPIQVDAAWTQAARESAQKFGLDERQFLEANEQFQTTFSESNRQNWIQIRGYEEGADGEKDMTQGYRAWEKAQDALDKVDRRRDASWEAITQRQLKDPPSGGHGKTFKVGEYLLENMGNAAQLRKMISDARVGEDRAAVRLDIQNKVMDHFEKTYGYPPSRSDVAIITKGYIRDGDKDDYYPSPIQIQSWKDNDGAKELANVMNGHALEISQSMSGWQVAGQIGGQILSAGAKAAATAAIAASDPRLKENISHVGHSPSGLNIYEFDYKSGLGPIGRYRGVMANEIPQSAVVPRAILGQYDAVNYDKVDVDFERLR